MAEKDGFFHAWPQFFRYGIKKSQRITDSHERSVEALLPIGDLLSLGSILSDRGYQFLRVEGFEEEGHPSSLQSGLLFTMPCGEEDHWNGGSGGVGLEAATGFDAPHARHPHVHDDQSGLVGNGQGDGFLAAFGFEYLEITAALEAEADQSANVWFVVYCYDHFPGHGPILHCYAVMPVQIGKSKGGFIRGVRRCPSDHLGLAQRKPLPDDEQVV